MSYTIAYTDAQNTFQADQVLENGIKLKSKTFDNSREIDLIHVDSEDIVQVGDETSPTHIQGKNILINGKDLEEEIQKLFHYGVDQKRKITDAVNSLYDDSVVSSNDSWNKINGVIEEKTPYPNYSFFIAPQRHHYLTIGKYASLNIFDAEKWNEQLYVISNNLLLLFGGTAIINGEKQRVDYVAEIDLRDFSKTYIPSIKPRRKDEFLLQDVHLVSCQESIYVIPKKITDADSKKIRQYVVNSDTWTTASLLVGLEVGDIIDGATTYKHLIFYSVNNGSRLIIYNTNTREIEFTSVFKLESTPFVDEVIYTNKKIYFASFERAMTSYEVVNIPCYDLETKTWNVVTGNNLGGSIFRIDENYYNFQQPKTSLDYKLPVVIYDYSEKEIKPVRSHSRYHEHRNNIYFGVIHSQGGALALVRLNIAYLFNSRLTLPISNSDGIIVNQPCNVYIDGTCPESAQGIYPNIKRQFYSTGFIQIEPMDVTKYVFGGVIRP